MYDERHQGITDVLDRERTAESPRGLRFSKTITIHRPVDEVYRRYRDFESFPAFMKNVLAVKRVGASCYRWTVKGPARRNLEWEAELYDERPGEHLSWRTTHEADVKNEGHAEFRPAPGGRGTELRVEIAYEPPGGTMGAVFSKALGRDPRQQLREDLYRFRQIVETGELATNRPFRGGRK